MSIMTGSDSQKSFETNYIKELMHWLHHMYDFLRLEDIKMVCLSKIEVIYISSEANYIVIG